MFLWISEAQSPLSHFHETGQDCSGVDGATGTRTRLFFVDYLFKLINVDIIYFTINLVRFR